MGVGVFRKRFRYATARRRRRFVSTKTSSGTITIVTPPTYLTRQRSGTTADIPITGTYTGTPTSIEASFSGGSYATIVASPTGGTFSGTLTSQAQGQGTLVVRFTNDTAVSDSVAYIGIGDVFLTTGQSNMDGVGTNNQVYTHATLKAAVRNPSDVWRDCTDPTRNGGLGSCLPIISTLYMADQGVPVAWLCASNGGTSIAFWAPGFGPLHTQASTLVNSCGSGGIKAILWYQGESDVGITDAATYEAALSTILDAWQTDIGQPTVKMVVACIAQYSTEPDSDVDTIRLALINRWNNDADILAGAVGHDQALDGLHWRTDAEMLLLGQRWWRTLKYHFFSGTQDARGPRLSSATFFDNYVTARFTGGQGALQNATDETGWVVADSNGSRTFTSLASSADGVLFVCDQALVAPVTITYCSGNNGTGTTLKDSGTYPLPPEPIAASVSAAGGGGSGVTGIFRSSIIQGAAA